MRKLALAIALATAATGALAEQTSNQALDAFFAAQWDRTMAESPLYASSLGDLRFNDRLDDLSLAAIRASQQKDREALAALRKIDPAALDTNHRESYEIYVDQAETGIDGQRFPRELMPITQQGSFPTSLPSQVPQLPFHTAQHYADYLTRLAEVPRAFSQLQEALAEGVKRGITPPRVPLTKVEPQLRAIAAEAPEESAFYAPFKDIPATVPKAEQERLQREGLKLVRDTVLPAYAKLADYWAKQYMPRTRETIGISALPDGDAWYAWAARNYTTTRLTPKEIHEIGLSEVKRIHEQMIAVMKQSGFKGELPAFFQFLRTDKQFYHTDARALLRDYRDVCKRIDAKLPELFGTLPRLSYGVAEIPAFAAPASTTAYYQPGSPDAGRAGLFFANTYRLETRPTWEMEALSAHESVPGHHLQIARAQELPDLPKWRREFGPTAFVEGWGLYSESLGSELGIYTDPYSHFGQLTYEMWRAVRLVVDTGMHTMGWTRQQAIDYFMQNASKQEHDITVEIDRYIVWPGQALGYKIGELKIKELRRHSEQVLGKRFDVRAFHDVVLGSGAVPLAVLERNVKAWVEKQK
jgi:uncharacterized protein (DUF885 family)